MEAGQRFCSQLSAGKWHRRAHEHHIHMLKAERSTPTPTMQGLSNQSLGLLVSKHDITPAWSLTGERARAAIRSRGEENPKAQTGVQDSVEIGRTRTVQKACDNWDNCNASPSLTLHIVNKATLSDTHASCAR
jgi:hypothetical protein